jgi:CHRD domain-containing protein
MQGRRMFGVGTLAAVLAVGSCTDEVGPTEVENFVANLSGANERPTPLTTTATGVAHFSRVGNLVVYRVEVTGIDSAFAAHIHAPADTGQPIGVAVSLYTLATPTGLNFSGAVGQGVVGTPTGMSTDSLLVLLRNGHAYVNVHTRGPTGANGSGGHAGGELRGQIARE